MAFTLSCRSPFLVRSNEWKKRKKKKKKRETVGLRSECARCGVMKGLDAEMRGELGCGSGREAILASDAT